MEVVASTLNQDAKNVKIKIVPSSHDILCLSCPNLLDGYCSNAQKIDKINDNHLQLLELSYGNVYSWHSILQIVKAKYKPHLIEELCIDCSWLNTCLCKRKLTEFLNTDEPAL